MNHLCRYVSVFLCALGVFASTVYASGIYVPTDLPAGAKYRMIFVTDDAMVATSTDIADYNDFVTTEANNNPGLAALHATWTAMLSTEAVNILDNTGLSVLDGASLFYNTQGVLVAEGVSGGAHSLFNSGSHVAALFGPNGNIPLTTTTVWTGSLNNTLTDFFAVGDPLVVAGYSSSLGPDWLGGDTFDSTNAYAVYGLSSILTVETPEPATLLPSALMLGLTLLARKGVRSRATWSPLEQGTYSRYKP